MGFGIGLGPRLFRVRMSSRGVRLSSGVGPFWVSTGGRRRRHSRRRSTSSSNASGCLPLLGLLVAVAAIYYIAAWPYLLVHHIAQANGSSSGTAKVIGWVFEGPYLLLVVVVGLALAVGYFGGSSSTPVPAAGGEPGSATGRPARPNVGGGRPITDYSQRELVDLVRWIEGDGVRRTHDELISSAVRELGFKRRGSRIVEALDRAIAAAHR